MKGALERLRTFELVLNLKTAEASG